MNFTLTINGETPAELLAALQQLNVPAALRQPQSEPATPQEKPKVPAPAKQKKSTEKPAEAPVEKQPETPANPTVPAEPAAGLPAPTSAQPGTGGSENAAPAETTATAASSEPEKDPVTENKIRSLIMALMKQGKQAECKRIIQGTGAKGISSLPPESYTAVWEQLLKLKDEVDGNAAD